VLCRYSEERHTGTKENGGRSKEMKPVKIRGEQRPFPNIRRLLSKHNLRQFFLVFQGLREYNICIIYIALGIHFCACIEEELDDV